MEQTVVSNFWLLRGTIYGGRGGGLYLWEWGGGLYGVGGDYTLRFYMETADRVGTVHGGGGGGLSIGRGIYVHRNLQYSA